MKTLAVLLLLVLFSLPATADSGADSAAGRAAFQAADYRTALQLLRPLAEAGDADAAMLVGGMAENGWGLPRSDAAAGRWYKLAADQGRAEALERLADFADGGRGMPADRRLAYALYQRAAAGGSARARGRIGEMALHGRGRGANVPEALAWLRQAAAADDPEALSLLDELALQRRSEPVPAGTVAPSDPSAARIAEQVRRLSSTIPGLAIGGDTTVARRADGSLLVTLPEVSLDGSRLSAHFGTIRLVVRDVSNDQAKLEVLLPSHIRLDEPSGRTLARLSLSGQRLSGLWSFRLQDLGELQGTLVAASLEFRQAAAVTACNLAWSRHLRETSAGRAALVEGLSANDLQLRIGLGGQVWRAGLGGLGWQGSGEGLGVSSLLASTNAPAAPASASARSRLVVDEATLQAGDQPGYGLRHAEAELDVAPFAKDLSRAQLSYRQQGLEGAPVAPWLADLNGKLAIERLPLAELGRFIAALGGGLLDQAMQPGAGRNAPPVDLSALSEAPYGALVAALGRAGSQVSIDEVEAGGAGWTASGSGRIQPGRDGLALALDAVVHGLDALLAMPPGLGPTADDLLRHSARPGQDGQGQPVSRIHLEMTAGGATVGGRPIVLGGW